MPSVSIAAYSYTLNLNGIISPSCTTYSFPSSLTRPFSFAAAYCSTCHKVIIADNFRTDKSAFKIRMDLSCRLRRFRSSLDRPCTDFRFSRRQVTDQTEKMITCADQFFKTRLFQSQFLKGTSPFRHHQAGKSLLLSPHIQRTLHSPRLPHTHEPPLLLHCSHHRPQGRLQIHLPQNNRFCSQKIITCKPLLLVLVICHKAFRHFIVFQMRFHTI